MTSEPRGMIIRLSDAPGISSWPAIICVGRPIETVAAVTARPDSKATVERRRSNERSHCRDSTSGSAQESVLEFAGCDMCLFRV